VQRASSGGAALDWCERLTVGTADRHLAGSTKARAVENEAVVTDGASATLRFLSSSRRSEDVAQVHRSIMFANRN
jgi:hypothetical protein